VTRRGRRGGGEVLVDKEKTERERESERASEFIRNYAKRFYYYSLEAGLERGEKNLFVPKEIFFLV
jgi:hypothetical protein